MNVAIYARVSTADQNPDMQIEDLKRFCAIQGYEIADVFVDHGYSGKNTKRPALDRLREASVKPNRSFDMIACWKMDRLGRSLRDLIQLMDEFKALGVKMYFHRDGIDTSTAVGTMQMHLLGAFAEFERATMRERIAAGVASARARGVKFGRKRLVISEDMVNALHSQGGTVRSIAKKMGVSSSKIQTIIKQSRNKA